MENILFIIFTNNYDDDIFAHLGISQFGKCNNDIAVIEADLNTYCINTVETQKLNFEKASILILRDNEEIDIELLEQFIHMKDCFYVVYHENGPHAKQKELLISIGTIKKYKGEYFCSHIKNNKESVYYSEIKEIAQAKNENDKTLFYTALNSLYKRIEEFNNEEACIVLLKKCTILNKKSQGGFTKEEINIEKENILNDNRIRYLISKNNAKEIWEKFSEKAIVTIDDRIKELIRTVLNN